jgi:hypothetical protein
MPSVYANILRAFSAMSARRCQGFSEGNLAVPLDLSRQARLFYRLRYHIDRSTGHAFKSFSQASQRSEVSKAGLQNLVFELDDNIYVGLCRLLAASDRAKKRKLEDTCCPQFILMLSDYRDDIFSGHATNIGDIGVTVETACLVNVHPKNHIAVKPLSTNRCAPLTKLDSSLAR